MDEAVNITKVAGNSAQDREQAQKNANLLLGAMEPAKDVSESARENGVGLNADSAAGIITNTRPTGASVGEIAGPDTVFRQDVVEQTATELVTAEQVKKHPQVKAFISKANEFLGVMGYTEHGLRHASLVGSIAYNILQRLHYTERDCELAYIAGYLHDIGNVVNRHWHAQNGALIAYRILSELQMGPEEIALIIGAIGNHDESDGLPISPVSAALIIADKSDVHRSRVRSNDPAMWDIHDRVNWATTRSFVHVDEDGKKISLEVEIDTAIAHVMEYFEIFLSRMLVSRRAAQLLGCEYHLIINGTQLL